MEGKKENKEVAKDQGFRKRLGRVLRETLGPLVWIYVILVVFVFNLDVKMLAMVSPGLSWLVGYKFFAILAITVLLLLLLGPKQFLILASFVAFYPIVVIFWKVPKHSYRQWPVILIFMPVIGAAVQRLRSTFLLYSLATFAMLFILTSTNQYVIIVAMLCLGPFLAVHLFRSVRKAYSSSLFTRLLDATKRVREAIDSGAIAPWSENQPDAKSTPPTVTMKSGTNPYELAYTSHSLARIVAERVGDTAKRRYHDLYLVASWFYTVFLTAFVFGFEHFGLSKIAPDSYTEAVGKGFWSFFGFSVSILTTSNLSKISPVSPVADVLSYSEVACSLIILVILVFLLLTGAREVLKDNVDEFQSELSRIVGAIEGKIMSKWELTIPELELRILIKNPSHVNQLRKIQGLEELKPPPSQESEMISDTKATGVPSEDRADG